MLGPFCRPHDELSLNIILYQCWVQDWRCRDQDQAQKWKSRSFCTYLTTKIKIKTRKSGYQDWSWTQLSLVLFPSPSYPHMKPTRRVSFPAPVCKRSGCCSCTFWTTGTSTILELYVKFVCLFLSFFFSFSFSLFFVMICLTLKRLAYFGGWKVGGGANMPPFPYFWTFSGWTCIMYKKLRNFRTVPPGIRNLVSKCAGKLKRKLSLSVVVRALHVAE